MLALEIRVFKTRIKNVLEMLKAYWCMLLILIQPTGVCFSYLSTIEYGISTCRNRSILEYSRVYPTKGFLGGGLTLSDESELQRKNLLKMINYLEIPE